ncbi:MAG: hypothetical protein OXC81_05620, partial [Betaproteobacteria bacterium]|nr:hypothetical protein [Betaproteobacteria bacterium]
ADPVGAPVVATDEDNDSLAYTLVGSSALFAVDSATGQISFKADTVLDHEATASYLVTLKAADGETAAVGLVPGEATVTVAIAVANVNEPPVLPELLDQTLIENVAGSYRIPAASDPDTSDAETSITYTAFQVVNDSPVAIAGNLGVSFDGDRSNTATFRTFTFASTIPVGSVITLRVVATGRGGLTASRDFVLRVRSGGAIVSDTSSLVALSASTRTSSFGVRLDVQPLSDEVTLTLASTDDADVSVTPVTMEFDRTNWNTAQQAMVRLVDETVKGSRSVSVSIGVFEQASSDSYYQGSLPHTVAVQVANANAPTEFDLSVIGAIELTLDENSGTDLAAAAVPIGDPIAATDEDNDDLTYSLIGTVSEFTIGAADGQLSAVSGVNFNHERRSSYELVVQATDGESAAPGLVPGIAMVTVTVQINDIAERPDDYSSHGLAVIGRDRNELTLRWSNSEYKTQFDEFDRASIVVSYGGGGFAGTLVAANVADAPIADTSTVRMVGLVPGVEYDITLHWYSADALAQSAAVGLDDQVSAANNTPTFVTDVSALSWAENDGDALTPAGTEIATIQGQDGDSDALTYSIRGGADAALFAIDAQSGVISLVRAVNFNHEVKASYTFMVGVSDIYGATTTAALMLAISDIAEQPVLPEQFAQIATVGVATTIALRRADDPETESRTIEYRAEQSNGQVLPAWVQINPSTGELTVGVASEAVAMTLTIRLQAVVAPSTSALVAAASGSGAVALNNPQVVNERVFELVIAARGTTNSRPDFTSATKSFSLDEGEYASGSALGMVVAQDSDPNPNLNYEIRGADSAPFAIVESSGALSVREGAQFDHEGKEFYRFLVDADDGLGGVSSTEIAVQIGDVNEAPEFLASRELYRVVGRSSSSFFVSPAIDPDDGDTITYTATPAMSWLSFTATASEVKFTATPAAPLGRHSVTLVASDGTLSARQVFVVDVQTSGNQAPEAAVAQLDIELLTSEAAAGMQIAVVRVTDPDGHTLSYRLTGSPAVISQFAIDGQGVITVADGVELAAGNYQFVVEVTDGNGGLVLVLVELVVRPASPDREDEVVLMAIDRAIASAASDIISQRLNSPLGAPTASNYSFGSKGEGEQELMYMWMASAEDQWNDWRYDHDSDSDRIERMEVRDYLYDRGFDLAVDGNSRTGSQLRMWGAGSRGSIDGSPIVDEEQVLYDGDVNLFLLGFEAGMQSTRFGLAAGRAKAKMDLSNYDARVERQLASFHPYLSYQASDSIRLWASGGFGKGDFIRRTDDSEITRDARYTSAAGGFTSSWAYHSVELSAGLEGLVVQSRLAADLAQSLDEVKSSSWRANLDFEVARSFALASEWTFRPSLGAHIRRDGGDEWLDEDEVDASAAVSVNWSRGLSAEFFSRMQVTKGDTYERNVNGRISYDFGSDGRGLLLTVAPSMSSSGTDADLERSLSATAGYGLPVRLFADSGLATFSADFSSADAGIVAENYGFRFSGRRLDVDLAADGDGDTYRLNFKLR